MSALGVVLRPVRPATWRELAYLSLGHLMSVVTFVVLVTLRQRVARHYRDTCGRGFWQRIPVVATDPQTSKDFVWLLLLTVIGFAFRDRRSHALVDDARNADSPALVVDPA